MTVVVLAGCGRPPRSNPQGTYADFSSPKPPEPSDEDKVSKFVVQLGGHVKRDDKQPGVPIHEINLSSTKITDTDMKVLASLNRLYSLNLSGTAVTDVGLRELKPHTNLVFLNLAGTGVTDAGMKEVA